MHTLHFKKSRGFFLPAINRDDVADVCERALRETEAHPLPPGLTDELKDGRLEQRVLFNLYPPL